MGIDGYNVGCAGKLDKRVGFLFHLKIFFVIAGTETAFLVFITAIGITKLAFQVQGILPLGIRTSDILGPVPTTHTAISTVVYLAIGADLYKERIAAEFKIIKRIGNQPLLRRYRVLAPLALNIFFARLLFIRIHGTRVGSQKQKA